VILKGKLVSIQSKQNSATCIILSEGGEVVDYD